MSDSVDILGVRVDVIDKQGLHNEILRRMGSGSKEYFANVNIHAVNIAEREPRFRRFVNRAPIVYCDGEGVRLGARLLGTRLPPRIVLTYWIWELCAMCEEHGLSIFLLGGTLGAAELAAARLRERYPRLQIAGTQHGYFQKDGPENKAILTRIALARPNILFVCFGMPLQEYWVEQNFEHIGANLILFGGSTIEYAAGRKKLAPRWMASHGLEWLYRLIQEPGRLWKRYLFGNPLFLLRVMGQMMGLRKRIL